MQIKDIIEVDIIDVGINSEGIAKHEGRVIFVPYTLMGERVKVAITELKPSFARANVIKVINPSQYRVEPLCPVFFKCGGCDMMHIDMNVHTSIKKEMLKTFFHKNYGKEVVINDFVSGKKLHYRSKIQLPIGKEANKIVVGYYKENTHKIIPYTDCALQGSWAKNYIEAFLDYANTVGLSIFDEASEKGLLRHLVLRKVGHAISVVVVINGNSLPQKEMFIEKLKSFCKPFSLHISENRKVSNVIMGDKLHLVYGDQSLKTSVLDTLIEVNPNSFMQVNDEIRDKIYSELQQKIKKLNKPIIVDAFSGIGVTSCIISDYAEHVYGIEIIKEAVENANNMAIINQKTNITNICGDVETELPKLYQKLYMEVIERPEDTVKMNLDNLAYNNILARKKKYDLRLNDATSQAIKNNDIIEFSNRDTRSIFMAKVISKHVFASFNEMAKALSVADLGFEIENTESLTDGSVLVDYDEVMSFTAQEIAENGVVAIEISVIKPETILILDPPRKGVDNKTIQSILSAEPAEIYYLSCNPATLTRDLKLLNVKYELSSITPYDMFPQTHHIETLVCLTRKN